MDKSTPRPPFKAGDLSSFSRVDEPDPIVVGPGSIWASRKDGAEQDSTPTGANPSPNMLGLEPNRSPSRKTRVGLGPGGPSEHQRGKLQPPQRSKPVKEKDKGKSGCRPRHSEFYFGSGNVVLVCEGTSFRVQSDLLSNNSQVFRDMLEPSRLSWEHQSDGCPCVHLSDAAEDFATLLKVFYTSG